MSEVSNGQPPQDVKVIQVAARARGVQDLRDHVLLQDPSHLPGQGVKARLIRQSQGNTARTAHCHGLEPLGPHHRAQTSAARHARVVVRHAGIAHLLLARRTYARHPHAPIPQLLLNPRLRLKRVQPPQVAGAAQLGPPIADVQPDRG